MISQSVEDEAENLLEVKAAALEPDIKFGLAVDEDSSSSYPDYE